MKRYFIEIVLTNEERRQQWLERPHDAVARGAGLTKDSISFVTWITDSLGPTGAAYEMLNVNSDEEFTFELLKLKSGKIGRTSIITEENTLPDWVEDELRSRGLI